MPEESKQATRNRLFQLADDPQTRPYVFGYLLSCLDERHWQALAESAMQFAADNVRLQREAAEQARRAQAELR